MMKIISKIAELANEINNNSMMRIVLFVDDNEMRITVNDQYGKITEHSLKRDDPCFRREAKILLLNLENIYNEENILQCFINFDEMKYSTYAV